MKQIFFIMVCLAILIPSASLAATSYPEQSRGTPSLQIAPTVFDLTYVPGTGVIKIINIANNGNKPLLVHSKIEQVSGRPQGVPLLKISEPDFVLQPQQAKKVKISISIPETIRPGGYYYQILFEPLLSSYYFEKDSTRVIPIIGALVYISVKDIENSAPKNTGIDVPKFSLTDKARLKNLESLINKIFGIEPVIASSPALTDSDSPFKFVLWIKNNDIYHTRPAGMINIFDKNGDSVGKTDFAPKTILPGEIKNFEFEINSNKKFLFGRYTAMLSLDDKKILLDLWIIPWKIMLSTGLLTLVLSIFMVKYRCRIRLAFKTLFSKTLT